MLEDVNDAIERMKLIFEKGFKSKASKYQVMIRESTEFSKQEVHGGLERNSNHIFEVIEK